MSTKRLTFLLMLLLISAWGLGVFYFLHRVNTEQQNYTERQLADLNVAWSAVQHLQQKGKDAYYRAYIMQPDVLDLLRQAQNPAQRDDARDQLYQKLYSVYQQIALQGVHQFQFVLPDNVSLLRMHSVRRFGDDLTGLRVSFRRANETLKPTFGFELGRVLPGFRSVYPIVDTDMHLGAVEFSNTFETLRKDIALLDDSREYALILHPRVKQELFDDLEGLYGASVFNQDWLEEDPLRELSNASPLLSEYANELGERLNQRADVRELMEVGENFGVYLTRAGQHYVVNFLAIKDIENQTAAYLVALSSAPLLDGFHKDLVNNIAVITILFGLLGWMILAVLRNREELRIAATAFNVQEGISITDVNGKILKVNQAFTELTGYLPEEVIGKTPAILSSGRQDKQFYQLMWQTLKKNGSWQGEIWNRRKDGELYAEWLAITAVYDAKGRVTHYVGGFLDITQRKEDEEQIQKLAFYDPLTELPNRRLLNDRLEHALATSSRTQRYGAVLFIDLDNFKALNDTKGHDLGDRLLIEVGQRLLKHTRESDTVSRLGGDEFVVLLEGLNQDKEKAYLEVEYLAHEIRESLNQPYCLDDYDHFSSPSIGIALFRGTRIPMEELLKNADSAMYQAKNAGRNTIRLFDPEMQLALEQRLRLQEDLRYALSHGQLELYYQSQVNDQDQIVGAEVLIRWHHPKKGLVSPAEFIPIAEESGLIIEMGDWIIEQSCMRLAQWATTPGLEHLTLSANISARQMRQANFVERVKYWVDTLQVKPGFLKLEITESMLLENLENTIEKMQELLAHGVLFSMDDFGTGYSSLSSIKRLPLDQIKIDQSFIRDLHEDEGNQVLTQTIIAMSEALNLRVIAEGVELEAQRETLFSLGCLEYQGYLFSKPLPYNDFLRYFKES